MYKKTFGMFLMGTLFFFCSCIDNNYDLNKGIATDVEIKDNKLTFPLGSLQAVILDSLISVEDKGILNKEDGAYRISISDSIKPYKYEVPEIKFDIPVQNANVPIDSFAKAEITEVHIKGQTPESTTFDVPDISLSDLEIPDVETDKTVCAANDEVKAILNQYGGVEENTDPISFYETFYLNDGKVDFEMEYDLPNEISTLQTIYLKRADDNTNSEKGALIGFEIIHPIALKDLEKTIDFEITFPKEFDVALDPTAEGNYSINEVEEGRRILVEGLKVNAGDEENSVIRFYLRGLNNLDESIVGRKLLLNKTVNYSVVYNVAGELIITNETTLEDFYFQVVTDLELAFRDVKGKTNDIGVAFEPDTIDFNIEFNNLKHIDKIKYIDFNAENSKLHFHSEMNGAFTPFTLKEGYALKLQFPEELIIDEALSTYPRKTLEGKEAIRYDQDEHAFYIYDLEVFNKLIEDKDSEGNPIYYHWALALDRFNLDVNVDKNGHFEHKVKAVVTVDSLGTLKEELVLAKTEFESLNDILESLNGKEMNFKIESSDLIIDDAMVHTERIVSKLSHTIPFNFDNNDLPKEIRRIEGIGFNNTPVFVNVKVNGLESLETNITLDLHVKMPSALVVSTNDGRIDVADDSLFMKVDIDPSSEEANVFMLTCDGLDFTKVEGSKEGIRPIIKDEKGYIEYKSDIIIVGDAYVEGAEFHSYVLENDISVDIDFIIPEIQVKDFSGTFYIDNIDNIKETFELNLGDNLDFLSNDANSIVLSDPQISISVDNSISIPISANLSLVGKDANGQEIENSVIESEIEIEAATYDQTTGEVTPRTTNLLISAKPKEVEGYTNLHIENLANLLKEIPASIDIALNPIIDTTNTQHISLVQPLSFGGSYEVAIPLQFDEFSFVYSDTIAGLNANLGEMMEMFSNVSVGFNMNIKNTMPLQILFKATPLDEMGDTIHGITISEFEIPAGTGQAFSDTIKGKDVHFKLESNDVNSIEALDKLKFDLHAKATSTEGGVALRSEQGIKLDNISIEVKGDVKIDD